MTIKVGRYGRKGNRTWYADFHYVDAHGAQRRLRRSTGTHEKKAALRIAASWYAELHDPEPPSAVAPEREPVRQTTTVRGFARWWLDHMIAPYRSPETLRRYEGTLRTWWIPAFGPMQVRDLHTRHVLELVPRMRLKVKPKTCNNALSVLSSMYRGAIKMGYAEDNPVTGVPRLPETPPDWQWLERDEADRFLAYLVRNEPEWAAPFYLLLRCGLRRGELVALRWDDLDLVRGVVIVRRACVRGQVKETKGKRQRVVPMTPDTHDVVRRHPRRANTDLLISKADGTFVNANWMGGKLFHRLRERAGVRRVTLHALRHSYASQLTALGTPLRAVQQLLGHSDPRTTERYSHLAPGDVARWVAALDTKLSDNLSDTPDLEESRK